MYPILANWEHRSLGRLKSFQISLANRRKRTSEEVSEEKIRERIENNTKKRKDWRIVKKKDRQRDSEDQPFHYQVLEMGGLTEKTTFLGFIFTPWNRIEPKIIRFRAITNECPYPRKPVKKDFQILIKSNSINIYTIVRGKDSTKYDKNI